jgi:phosphate transport system permease protein
LDDGRAVIVQPRYSPRYADGRQTGVDLKFEELYCGQVAPSGSPVTALAARFAGDRPEIRIAAISEGRGFVLLGSVPGVPDGPSRPRLTPLGGEPDLVVVRFGAEDTLAGGSRSGRLYHWAVAEDPESEAGLPAHAGGRGLSVRLTDELRASSRAITALEWALGGVTILAGDANGQVSAFFRARLSEADEEPRLVRARTFPALQGEIRSLVPSRRDRTFIALADNGDLGVFFGTTGHELARSAVGPQGPTSAGRANGLALAPRGDAIYVADGATLRPMRLFNPHPEVSIRALFGGLWYEGYPGEDHVWQSTGGTDDFEVKLSLRPLIFGTIKGTAYALLFAIPIAVAAALYTSQFASPGVRSVVKPAVEIMAALPSVVIGFIAGLWLAPLADRHLMAVLLMLAATPFLGVLGAVFAPAVKPRMPRSLHDGGYEILVIPVVLITGYWVLLGAAPAVEAALFRGDLRLWLSEVARLSYDQRNCLVVGIAMGFAVIPIIFTISEDAFSSVPSNLSAASLALGASRWQTALQVVLPTASPGVFSAVMVGFGRAVGETMIVLMATGNTPVFDWSIFNGMRTLSANIAVEIPEAPQGGTLYRILFLAASLLFAMTFAVNTLAEVIRQRLRERYRAL